MTGCFVRAPPVGVRLLGGAGWSWCCGGECWTGPLGDVIFDICCSSACSCPRECVELVDGVRCLWDCCLGIGREGVLSGWGGREWVREGGLGVAKDSCFVSRWFRLVVRRRVLFGRIYITRWGFGVVIVYAMEFFLSFLSFMFVISLSVRSESVMSMVVVMSVCLGVW